MDITVNGPRVIFEIPLLGGIPVTETVVNSWLVLIALSAVCIYLGRNLSLTKVSKRQAIAEKLVEAVWGLTDESMGTRWRGFAPYIGALFAFSLCSSLLSLTGLRPPTADLSTTLALSLITFMLVQVLTVKNRGVSGFFKRFIEPVPVVAPLNIISEIANPVSMSFRHFGNIAAGTIITSIIYSALAVLSSFVLQIIPNAFIQSIPIFQLGIPAVLSLYFDIFTAVLQAYVFCMLTMVFVSGTTGD